ncbi:MAG: MraY family glycosyltransferase [Thermoanaerobaculia bacterium]
MSEFVVPLALLFVCSGLTSFIATAIVRNAALTVGLVDQPGRRKIHTVATPRLGGLAIIFGFGFPLLLLAGNARAAELVTDNVTQLFGLLAAGSLVVGLGVYDDLVGTNAPKKFVVQIAAALILVAFGFRFDVLSIATVEMDLGWLGAAASVLWIVGIINAVNFIDGLDSLATAVSLTTALAFAVIAVLRYDLFSLVVMTALGGSLVGFAPWNRPPAKIFMGDSGSLFIGLLLASIAIVKPSKSPTAILLGGPLLALALPAIDTLMVMRERFQGSDASVRQRVGRIFDADRRHIHHILVERYGSTHKAVLSVWLVTVLFAAAAVMTSVGSTKWLGYGTAAVALVAILALRFRRKADVKAAPPTDAEVRA